MAKSVAATASAVSEKLRLHWLNTLIIVLLLIALAVVSLLAFRRGPVKAELVNGSANQPQDALASLADLQVPQIHSNPSATSQTPMQSGDEPAGAKASSPKSQLGEPTKPGDLTSSNDSTSDSGSLIAGLDTRQLARPELAPRPAAQVQLGIPVPMLGAASSSFAERQRTEPAESVPGLSPAGPRYDTVSTPSPAKSTPATATETTRAGDSGASPTLYDGAQKTPQRESTIGNENGLVLSGPAGSANDSPAVGDQSVSASQSANLGVTVGGGLAHPTNLGEDSGAVKTTATPDMDAAAISKKYLEHVQRKNAMLASSGSTVPNTIPPSNYQGNMPTASVSSGTPLGGQAPATAAVMPYGTTGPATTPYVRNAPGTQPSGLNSGGLGSGGLGSGSFSSGSPPSSTSVGYKTNMPAMGNGGYTVPARSPSYPSLDAAAPSQPTAGAAGQPTGSRMSTPANPWPSASTASGAGLPGSTLSAAGSSGGATYPRGSQLAGAAGQAPLGMIGPSGYATAPSGDFVGGGPTPVTGTIGFATSTVGGMPTDARPTNNAAQGAGGIGAASPYSAAPQYR